jgi:hypothetical protein
MIGIVNRHGARSHAVLDEAVSFEGLADGRSTANNPLTNRKRSLVTGNTADNNGDVGIEARCPSTVTFNNASGNVLDYNLFGTPPCDAHNNTSSTGTPP